MIAVPILQPQDAAWLAGYIDGDGCVVLAVKGDRFHRTPLVAIDSCDDELLTHVQSLVGGRLQVKKRYADHHRQTWSWRLLGTQQVVDLLRQLLPYMRCEFKKTRAEMIVSEWRKCTPRNGVYTAERLEAKIDFEKRFLAIGEGRGKRSYVDIAA